MRNFPKLSSNSLDMLVKRMHKKASQSISRYRISAVAFDKNGEFIAQSFNNVPMEGVEPKHGSGIHYGEFSPFANPYMSCEDIIAQTQIHDIQQS